MSMVRNVFEDMIIQDVNVNDEESDLEDDLKLGRFQIQPVDYMDRKFRLKLKKDRNR